MYTEASNRKLGDKARLLSPVEPAAPGGSCLQFWYHMYGARMGTLSVRLKVNGLLQNTPLWSESGNKGNVWKVATTTIKSRYSYQVWTCHFPNWFLIVLILLLYHVQFYCYIS